MGKVERRVVADGDIYEIACAVRADCTTSPVAEFLDQLADGLVDESSAPDLEPDEQIGHRVWLDAAFERFAEEGDLPGPRDSNQLRDGVWEIKRFNLRITFFDTDGEGGCDPKIDFDGAGFWGAAAASGVRRVPPARDGVREATEAAAGTVARDHPGEASARRGSRP